MKRNPYWRHPGRGGFTLVELLVVMGIIGMLIGLLMPAVNYAILAVAVFKTGNIISQIDTALAAYQADHGGEYPPVSGPGVHYGYESIGYYLAGEGAGGSGEPYYHGEGGAGVEGIYDALKPSQPILYYRREVSGGYDYSDNPIDTEGREGFKSQNHFEDLVNLGTSTKPRWVRPDYLLISAGPDRIFGYVAENKDGNLVPAGRDDAGAMCDDIANFKYE